MNGAANQPLPVNYLPLPFEGALPRRGPEELPVLEGAFPTFLPLPPLWLPLFDFAIVITSFFVDIHCLTGDTMTSQLRQSCFACYKMATILPFMLTFDFYL